MGLRINAANRAVAVRDGRISERTADGDVVLEFPDAFVRAGLINAHDHLHRNHHGRLGEPPYRNACAWAHDIQSRHRQFIAEGQRRDRREALLAGAWKNLFAGVTRVVHHDRWERDFDDDFPLQVVRIRNADSLGMTPALEGLAGDGPFCLHLAEGIDADAAEEIRTLAAMGLLSGDLIAVHGVGMDAAGVELFRASGAALVWCPTSNDFLFGRTAPATLLADGVDVLLGSDSLLTAEGDLLDELRCARPYGLLSDARLEAAVGAVAARRLGIDPPSLTHGAVADLVVLARPLLEACAEDVLLVVVSGTPRVARPDLAPCLSQLGLRGEALRIGEVVRWVNAPAAAHGRSYQ